jgi:hypothetical protein
VQMLKVHLLTLLAALIVICLFGIVFVAREGYADAGSGTDSSLLIRPHFLDATLWSSKIPNAPAPAGTDINGQIMYSNAAVEANVTKIKQDLANLNMNIPGMISQAVGQQVPVHVGQALRNHGYPLTDSVYGSAAFALQSLQDGCHGSAAANAGGPYAITQTPST